MASAKKATPVAQTDQYYRFDFTATTSSADVTLGVYFRHADYYSGIGDEFGVGTTTGQENLLAIAEGIAAGFKYLVPAWTVVTVTSISAVPIDEVQIYTAPTA